MKPTLEWIGKDKMADRHMEAPYRLLKGKYTYNAETSDNMIIQGVNLETLEALPLFSSKSWNYIQRYGETEQGSASECGSVSEDLRCFGMRIGQHH